MGVNTETNVVASHEERCLLQDDLLFAFEASGLVVGDDEVQTCLAQVVTPAIFPELFPDIRDRQVIELQEYSHIEPVGKYRPRLEASLAELVDMGIMREERAHNLRAYLGWAAARPQAVVIPFPRQKPKRNSYPSGHMATVINLSA